MHRKRIEIHFKNSENLAETIRRIRTFFGGHEAPCRNAIQNMAKNFKLSGNVSDVMNKTHAHHSTTGESIAAVTEDNPGLSIYRR